jgi:hypothetical protein
MRWFSWQFTRTDVFGGLFAVILICVCAVILVRHPSLDQATGFGPDWECKSIPNSEPVCMKKISH